MPKLVAAAVGFSVVALAFASSQTACFPQNQCPNNPPLIDYCALGDANCKGHLIDPYHWESVPIDGTWLPFNGEQLIVMHFRDATTNAALQGTFFNIEADISPDQIPSQGGQFSNSAGNLAEFSTPDLDSSNILEANVVNDSCASYFVRVVVTAVPDGDASPDVSTGE